ncbi:MAG: flagellar basal body-associated FliL family protein [Zoogloeaceae bacterium]|jgi:flagellar FliL protein|nr:flagellar basal body-associated FliL family protein [Zoogloeaceae bacterium]
MAKEKETPPAAGARPKNRMKLIVILLSVVLLVIVLSAGAVFLLLSGKHASGDDEGDEDEAVVQDDEKKPASRRKPGAPPVFSELDEFTVNLMSEKPAPRAVQQDDPNAPTTQEEFYPEEDHHFLQVKITLELDTPEADALIKAQMPRIRNNVTALLADKTVSALQPKAGKEALANEIMQEINDIIAPRVKGKRQEEPVISVLFTLFIIQ